MNLISLFITIGILMAIVWQDFKYRAIWWFLPAGLFAAAFWYSVLLVPFRELMIYFIFNLLVISFMMVVVYLWYSYKNRSFRLSHTGRAIGLGDVLYLPSLCLLFSPALFILFLVAALLITLVCSIAVKLVTKKDFLIPLAGALSLCLMVVLLAGSLGYISLYQDPVMPY